MDTGFWVRIILRTYVTVILVYPTTGYAKLECRLLEEQPIKLEAWLSKKYRANLGHLRKEFAAMGDTEVSLWLYPAENPSGVVAIGACVPAFIARYALQKALTYTQGVKSLVHQGFVYPHWIGIGTSLFSEWAQQSVTPEQLKSLLDNTLSTREFQTLYRQYSIQDEMISGFGMQVPNPKLMVKEGLGDEDKDKFDEDNDCVLLEGVINLTNHFL